MATSPKDTPQQTGPLDAGHDTARPLCDRPADRRRRDGDGLSRARSAAGESSVRDQRDGRSLHRPGAANRGQRIFRARSRHPRATEASGDSRDNRPLRARQPPLPGDGVRRGAQPRRGSRGARRAAARRPRNRHRAPAVRRARLPARAVAADNLPRHEAVERDAQLERAGRARRFRDRAAVQGGAQGHDDRHAGLRATGAIPGSSRPPQ